MIIDRAAEDSLASGRPGRDRESVRAAPHRDPSWFELVVGLSAFVTLATAFLYLLSRLGR